MAVIADLNELLSGLSTRRFHLFAAICEATAIGQRPEARHQAFDGLERRVLAIGELGQ
jgi:hypothetical protein